MLAPVAHARDVAVLLDGRPELAAALGVDGVHLGGDGPSCAEARRRLGADAMIGVACGGSRHRGMVAAEQDADYVSFGAFFPSLTKPDAALADPDIVAWWAELMEVPCVAVGGITPGNCAPLVSAGADFLAVSAGVWRHPDGPAAAVRAFEAAFAQP